MKAFTNKSENFKLNTSPYRQPVETTQDRSYVFKFPFETSTEYEPLSAASGDYAGLELRVQILIS